MGQKELDVLVWLDTYGRNWVWPDLTPLLQRVFPSRSLRVLTEMDSHQHPDVVVNVHPDLLPMPKGWTRERAVQFCADEGILLLWVRWKAVDNDAFHKRQMGGHVQKTPREVELMTSDGRLVARCPVKRDGKPGLNVWLGEPSYVKRLEQLAA